MTVSLPGKINCKTTIKFMLFFLCIERLLESFGLPHAIIFLLDIANVCLFINLLININSKTIKSIKNPIIISQIIIVGIGIIVSLFSGTKLLLILWAIRNLCRFWIFYCACVIFLNENDVKEIFDLFIILFYLNFLVILIQYAMGYKGDYLGGIFGVTKGANAYSNIFLVVVCTYELACWFNKKEKTLKLILILSIAVLISALAELKIFFVEIALILILVFIIDCFIKGIKGNIKYIFRALSILGVLSIMLVIGINILGRLYPNFKNFFTIESFIYNNTRESGYSGSGDLNRLTAISTINSSVFPDLNVNKFLGLGLGSTEYSRWSAMTSWFYDRYSYLHYYWFSHAWMYLENGYLGLILYPAGFVLNGILAIRNFKKQKIKNASFSIEITGIVLSFIMLILYLYNQSMRLECAYMLYFCFAAMRIGEVRKNE